MEGLASQLAGSGNTMMYGDGGGNTITHHYAGTLDKPKKKRKRKCKKNQK